MKIEAFKLRWRAALPEIEPHGQSLRAALSDRWFRVHSLPESKRYAETSAERAEILRRHLGVLRHVFGAQPLTALFSVWDAKDGAARFGFTNTESWTVPAGTWLDRPRRLEVSEAVAIDDERLPNVILTVADDETDGVVLVAADLNTLVALYDGGADIFLANSALRDETRAHFAAWASSEPDRSTQSTVIRAVSTKTYSVIDSTLSRLQQLRSALYARIEEIPTWEDSNTPRLASEFPLRIAYSAERVHQLARAFADTQEGRLAEVVWNVAEPIVRELDGTTRLVTRELDEADYGVARRAIDEFLEDQRALAEQLGLLARVLAEMNREPGP